MYVTVKGLKTRPVAPDDVMIRVPCGKCDACLMARAGDWALRSSLESMSYRFNCFLTLTVDNDHLNYNSRSGKPEVHPKVLQDFFKRLRIAADRGKYDVVTAGKMRAYLACGEYGSARGRQHYHAILFGFCPSDLILFGKSKSGRPIYRSEVLERIWTHGMVFVGIDVSPSACGYVARYTLKKRGFKQFTNQKDVQHPPFQIYSKNIPLYYKGKPLYNFVDNGYSLRPRRVTGGLGSNWVLDNLDTYLVGYMRDRDNPALKLRIPRSLHNAVSNVRPDLERVLHDRAVDYARSHCDDDALDVNIDELEGFLVDLSRRGEDIPRALCDLSERFSSTLRYEKKIMELFKRGLDDEEYEEEERHDY